MRIAILALFTIFSIPLFAQDFYNLETVQTIEITFAQSNWDALLDAEKAGDENYILATSININGTILDSVGVKYKGNSTYNPNQTKNPFHIELDTYKDHDYDGYTDIKLSNVAKDPSFLREVLSYKILRQYMDAPLSNYANVYVNGTHIGLYSNSESISKKFVNSRFYSKDNTFVKCNPPAGAGPGSDDKPNLDYLGTDSINYEDAYEIKSDYGWDELIELCNVLNNDFENIEEILDIDRAIWMIAYNNALVNLDSYSGRFAQNYYLYRDDNDRFASVVWDLNESFGRFSDAGSGAPLNNTTAKSQMDHLLHDNDNDYPLIQKILSNPQYKRMYLAHLKTIMEENFAGQQYYADAVELHDLIAEHVQADNNKFFTYNNFETNIDSDVSAGGPMGTTPGIANLMDGRYTYLSALDDFTVTQPDITNRTLSNDQPLIGETIDLTATISDANTVLLGVRSDYKDKFEKQEMFDDGMHNDGEANDGVYGVSLEISSAYTQYFIYAENDQAGRFSPARAEHEYHTITATISDPEVGDIVINEFMASNDATQADQDGEYDDWIELYNNSDEAISLDAYGLSDDADALDKWTFPVGTMIEAGGYVVVWVDKDEEQEGLHANFKLSAAAESIFLVTDGSEIEDEVSYVDQESDISYGRFVNGTGNFQLMNPTFGAENTGDLVTVFQENTTSFSLYPNPTQGIFKIELEEDTATIKLLQMYDLHGRLVMTKQVDSENWIDATSLVSGMYYVKIDQQISKIIVE